MSCCMKVAHYIVTKIGTTEGLKLHRLLYYIQAWTLVWDDDSLFEDEIQAWVNGPIITTLWNKLDCHYTVGLPDLFGIGMTDTELTPNQKDKINHVLEFYGHQSSDWLTDVTKMEDPWIKARKDCVYSERGHHIISLLSMARYYSSLDINLVVT